jgi:L-phenylalanine/L-methionine N-acetyltransferase
MDTTPPPGSTGPDTAPRASITLRRATARDAAAFARINGHPDVQPNLMQLPYGAEERWTQVLADNLLPGRTDFVLVAERDGQVVCSAGLHPAGTQLRRRHVMSLGISVAPEAHGQGVGRALMAALCDYADDWGQVLRTELTVFADNARAIALYRRFGFEHEGTHRGYALRAGRYVDAWSMARLHPSPPQIAPGPALT